MRNLNDFPLVSVICLCYNHEQFVAKAINSVLNQSHANFELIVINDASTDKSAEIIVEVLDGKHIFINHAVNQGMCKSFNEALGIAKGKYVIDLAADDYFLPDKLSKQVKIFESLPAGYGVVYSDALLIDQHHNEISTFVAQKRKLNPKYIPPQGDVFCEVLNDYCIMSPTMMFRKSMLDQLEGYDENLSYEDYDFFIRSSRNWKYYYIDETLIAKRMLPNSDSRAFYKIKNQHLISSLTIVKKAKNLLQTELEKVALVSKIRYFIRLCLYTHHWDLAFEFAEILKKTDKINFITRLFLIGCRLELKLNGLYLLYTKRKW